MDSKENERYATRYANFFHELSSGIFNYRKTDNIWWKLYRLYSRTATATFVLSNILYLIVESYSLRDFAFLSVLALSPVAMTIVLQANYYKYSKHWIILKKILEQDFAATLNTYGCDRAKNFKLPRFILLYVMILVAGAFICCLWLCLQLDVNMEDKFNYFYIFPAIHSVNTRGMFLLINLLQLVSYLGVLISAISSYLHLYIVSVEIFDKSVLLEERMKSISDDVHHTIALVTEFEAKIDTTKSPRLRELMQRKSQNDKKNCFQTFDDNLKICIRHHQKLQHAIKCVKPLMDNFFTITLLFCLYEAIVSAFLITSKEKLDLNIPVFKCILILLFTICQLGLECLMAQHFHNMNDSMAEQVYSLPWYELSPSYRKNVYIFLCQAQARVDFVALQTFPFSKYFFPKVLNFVYTHTMNLLILQAKFRQT